MCYNLIATAIRVIIGFIFLDELFFFWAMFDELVDVALGVHLLVGYNLHYIERKTIDVYRQNWL